ncbi:hypothetical protein [Maliponia aquimaris]|uniref:Uncharacterized protein n=1 Tax=Maliponia aquimaris TaxID=1673631 RepID=A0A238KH84_9RHOB|nr:hypothetical protein [Maliponia aquimaris]SMX41954.1 hypothetical protein MAA8898_02493 [Maliponia aquimaris]
MRFRAARTGLGPALALMLSAQAALADAHSGAPEGISPTESALADLLITLAELELTLTRNGAAALPPPPDGGDLLDRVNARLTLLDGVRPAPAPDAPDAEKLAGLPAPESPETPLPAADAAPDSPAPDPAAPDADFDPIAAALGFSDTADPPDAPEPPAAQTDPPPAAPPAGEPFVAVSLNGTAVHSLVIEDLTDADKAAMPDASTCPELGDWFLALPLQRDFKSVFVIEGEFVRVCRELGRNWLVKRANTRERAHLVKRPD